MSELSEVHRIWVEKLLIFHLVNFHHRQCTCSIGFGDAVHSLPLENVVTFFGQSSTRLAYDR